MKTSPTYNKNQPITKPILTPQQIAALRETIRENRLRWREWQQEMSVLRQRKDYVAAESAKVKAEAYQRDYLHDVQVLRNATGKES